MGLIRIPSAASWFLTLVLLASCSRGHGQLKPGPVCDLIPPSQNPDRELPRLPDAFQTKVELNIVNKQVTVVAYESYDRPNNRSFLSLAKDVRETKSYVDYNTNEVHVVYEKTKCKSVPLDTSDERVLLGQVTINGVRYTYSVVSALKFGQEFGQKYMGRDTVRGITSDHWRSCQHWDSPAANFTVDYYFAIPEWTQTQGASAMPVRAVVEGLSSHGSEGLHSFKHIYDFISFQPYADKDAELYQTPDGVYCEDRQKTRAVPELPQSFRYRTEVVQPWSSLNTGIIFNMDLWYDYNHKLGRYDFALPLPVSFIFDYGIGVRYMKDVREDTCKMVGFGIWSKGPPGNNQLILEMLDPKHIFFLDDTYVYTGKVMHRGIPCDRFITRKTFGTEELSWNATMEYCIIDRRFVEIGDSATMTTNEVPMTLKFAANGFYADMNHFDFEHIDMSEDMKMFDVADCYNPGDRKDIMITFDATFIGKISMYKGNFISDVIARIAKVAHVSPIRVQRPRLDFDATNTYFTSTLLNRVPFDVLFSPNQEGDNVGLVSVDDQVNDVRFERLCAEMCQDMRDDQGEPIKCNSFAYCFADNRCLLSTNHVARPGSVKVASYCRADTVKYYNRVVPAPELPDVRLEDAMSSLKNSILAGDFKIYFKPNDGDELRIYKATEIKTGFKRGDGEGTEKLVRDFKQIRKRIFTEKYIKVDIDTGLSLDECAAACERKDNFVCQSFAFCGNVGKCMLAAEHPEEKTDMLLNTTSCDVYSRNYLQKFKHFMGQVLPQKDAVTLLKVESWERCAVLCVTQKGWSCKSFDYCISSQTCRLNKRHVLDMPAGEGSLKPAPGCHHFSRLYIDDFRQTSSNQVIALRDVNILRDVDVTQCAKTCVENLGSECKGFDFCGNETFCVLSSKYYRDKGIGKVVTADRAVCSHYSRTSFPDGTAFVPQRSNRGYSGGAMFGLGIGMLILGMLLLVFIAAVVIKVKGGSSDNMKTALLTITNPGYAN